MTREYKIMDRFRISGRGMAYMIQYREGINHHRIGDVLYDSRGNRFKVNSLDASRGFLDDEGHMTRIMLFFDNLDNVEVNGDSLFDKEENAEVE